MLGYKEALEILYIWTKLQSICSIIVKKKWFTDDGWLKTGIDITL